MSLDRGRPELEDIRPDPTPAEVSTEPDARTQEWEEDQQREAGRLRLSDLRATQELRSRYGWGIFILMVVWFVVVGVAFILDGIGILDVETPVMVAALGTTSINVLGLVAIVTRYLFPKE